MVEDEIRELCRQLIESTDDAETTVLASRLQQLQHDFLETARRRIRILPLLESAPKRKNAA